MVCSDSSASVLLSVALCRTFYPANLFKVLHSAPLERTDTDLSEHTNFLVIHAEVLSGLSWVVVIRIFLGATWLGQEC